MNIVRLGHTEKCNRLNSQDSPDGMSGIQGNEDVFALIVLGYIGCFQNMRFHGLDKSNAITEAGRIKILQEHD